MGGPDLRRAFQTRIALCEPPPPSDWRFSHFSRMVPTHGQQVGTVCPHCRRCVNLYYAAPRWLGPLRPRPALPLGRLLRIYVVGQPVADPRLFQHRGLQQRRKPGEVRVLCTLSAQLCEKVLVPPIHPKDEQGPKLGAGGHIRWTRPDSPARSRRTVV